jgi:2-polyprenyl-6-methoxyphenol hydroxylase-like FAD-dependent oxidoreductase
LARDRVAIIGAGIGGLSVALALKDEPYDIVIIERDPEPPDIDPKDAFEKWQRPGVPQFRHAHIVLARAQTLLRDRHPAVHADLLRAGLELSRLEEVLPPSHRDHYRPEPGDQDLLHFWGRRPTFEYVFRQHVGRLPNVRFMHSARVTGLVLETTERQVRVRGVHVSREGHDETVDADIVVDASGKRSKSAEWLEPGGVRIEKDSKPSGFVYACRHYQLKDPGASPPRLDGGGNLDFLGYATFYAEHGSYALTFGCPIEEKDLAAAMHRSDGFEALCAQLPVLKEWTRVSEVRSKVLGAGLFENRWTRHGVSGGRDLLGFFPVGDSHLETNPMYGRGCSAALMQAHALADLLREVSEPAERIRRYYASTREMLQAYFDLSVATDRMYHMRARLSRGEPITAGERLLNWGYEAAWIPAVQSSELVAREMVKSAQMRELSSLATRLAVVYQLILALVLTVLGRRRRAAPAGPPRVEVLGRLPAHTDDARVQVMEPSSNP